MTCVCALFSSKDTTKQLVTNWFFSVLNNFLLVATNGFRRRCTGRWGQAPGQSAEGCPCETAVDGEIWLWENFHEIHHFRQLPCQGHDALGSDVGRGTLERSLPWKLSPEPLGLWRPGRVLYKLLQVPTRASHIYIY